MLLGRCQLDHKECQRKSEEMTDWLSECISLGIPAQKGTIVQK